MTRSRYCRTLQLFWTAFRPLLWLLLWLTVAVVISFGLGKLFAHR